MTDKELDNLLQSIIKLGKEDTPGQVHDAIYRLDLVDGSDLFVFIAGMAMCGHPTSGKNITIKQAVKMVKK